MNKRLREKLLKNGQLGQQSLYFLKNSATFFCGEKRIVELYAALNELSPHHELLTFGQVREDGHFRFHSSYPEKAPEHLKNKPFFSGVPTSAGHTLHYIDRLMDAIVG